MDPLNAVSILYYRWYHILIRFCISCFSQRLRFGGASFSELLDSDLDDASMSASAKKNFEDQVGRVLAAAERIMGNGR